MTRLVAASAAAAAVTAAAGDRGLAVTVAVADAHGALVALVRMDGAAGLSARTAQHKIATVLHTGRSTLAVTEELVAGSAAEPGLLLGMVVHGGVVPIPGGVPLVRAGVLLGALGVSGASSADDHALAVLGAAEWASRSAATTPPAARP
ncbi:hypothetical protein BJF78_10835 [Pseudonocardia sp. CNS-139]|nr:hypothetical protein BJF78_10835 [Pseudonocardia sp. CNS-139]